MKTLAVSYQANPRQCTITVDGTEIATEVRHLSVEMVPEGAKITIWRQRIIDDRAWDTTDEYFVTTLDLAADAIPEGTP